MINNFWIILDFVVHKSRAVTTLSSLQEPIVPMRTRAQKLADSGGGGGDNVAAGLPSSRGEESRRPSFAGRRSRRNSNSDDSQLTIENFGGSQDQLHMIGRALERDRKSSIVITAEPAVAVRSTLQDARGSIQFGYDDDDPTEKQENHGDTSRRNDRNDRNDTMTSIAHSKDMNSVDVAGIASENSHSGAATPPVRKTSFATLPNTTTWQQQSVHYQPSDIKSELLYIFK